MEVRGADHAADEVLATIATPEPASGVMERQASKYRDLPATWGEEGRSFWELLGRHRDDRDPSTWTPKGAPTTWKSQQH